MDAEKFVQNVKNICMMKEVLPTVACRESGAGKSLLSEVARGIVPSVNKVQALAQYLGVTTSELLGEVPSPADISAPALQFAKLYLSLPAEAREQIVASLLEAKEKYKK